MMSGNWILAWMTVCGSALAALSIAAQHPRSAPNSAPSAMIAPMRYAIRVHHDSQWPASNVGEHRLRSEERARAVCLRRT